MLIKVGLPVDNDRGLRRCCPFCKREFKIVLTEEELKGFAQKDLESFMIEANGESDAGQSEPLQEERTCPYCGQKASVSSWWTQAQVDFFMDIARNMAIKEINKSFKRLERLNRPSSPVKFEAREIKQVEPRVLSEPNDMKVFELPCCDQRIKIKEDWSDKVYCFFCGFPHESEAESN